MTLLIPSVWAAFVWPPLGVAMGLFAALTSKERSILVAGAYVVVGLLGASAGGVLTYLLTFQRALLGGFWTSIVTSMLGGLIFLGLWKSWLEAYGPPRSD